MMNSMFLYLLIAMVLSQSAFAKKSTLFAKSKDQNATEEAEFLDLVERDEKETEEYLDKATKAFQHTNWTQFIQKNHPRLQEALTDFSHGLLQGLISKVQKVTGSKNGTINLVQAIRESEAPLVDQTNSAVKELESEVLQELRKNGEEVTDLPQLGRRFKDVVRKKEQELEEQAFQPERDMRRSAEEIPEKAQKQKEEVEKIVQELPEIANREGEQDEESQEGELADEGPQGQQLAVASIGRPTRGARSKNK